MLYTLHGIALLTKIAESDIIPDSKGILRLHVISSTDMLRLQMKNCIHAI